MMASRSCCPPAAGRWRGSKEAKCAEDADDVLDKLAAMGDMLTPEIVKLMMEEVIRDHLGWLVVWGNVFGGIIGVVSLAAGYG